jgi:hypothetical protein
MSQSVIDIESTIEDLKASIPKPVTSNKMPRLAVAINLAINAAKDSAESASILAKLSKEHPEISHQARLAAEVASDAATFAVSVASICIECTERQKKDEQK